MTQSGPSIGLPLWLQSPPGRYLLAWEQQRIDAHVADVFGFHALQLGLPELDGLRANRMPHRWLACLPGHAGAIVSHDEVEATDAAEGTSGFGPLAGPGSIGLLHCDPLALPFPNHSVDLIVLPHTLELAADAHQTLREVERVLVPEGRVVILGFNPTSLWGLRQWSGRLARRLRAGAPPATDLGGADADDGLFMPRTGEFIGLRRLRDWLRLLSFEVERGGFGCYRPPLASQAWLDRYAWVEKAGDRWWPMFGAVYMVSAVKRVRGMRIIAPAASKRLRKARAAPAVASTTHRDVLAAGVGVAAGSVVGDSGERLLRRLRQLAEDPP